MKTYRKRKDSVIKGFTQVPNNVLWDSNLSFQAKGLWAYINSKPPNWDFSANRMSNETKEGRKSVLKGLKELEEAGYLFRRKLPSGRVVYKIHPVMYKMPDNYEPPVPFNECREQIQLATGMTSKEAQISAQGLVEQCSQAQIKRSEKALKAWIIHEKAKVPNGDS